MDDSALNESATLSRWNLDVGGSAELQKRNPCRGPTPQPKGGLYVGDLAGIRNPLREESSRRLSRPTPNPQPFPGGIFT